MEKKFGSWSSSQNPEELANRVKGIVVASSSIIIFIVARIFHVTWTPNDVLSLATEAGTVVGAIWTLYGVGLAIITKFKARY